MMTIDEQKDQSEILFIIGILYISLLYVLYVRASA